jgi:hypothetical protein
MMRLIAVLMLIVGGIWILCIGWAFMTLSGMSVPVSTGRIILDYGGMLAVPAAMIVGSILILRGVLLRTGAILIGAACLILTGLVAYECAIDLHPQPLQMRPPYLLYAVVMVLVLLVDLAAWKLYRLATPSTAGRNPAEHSAKL